ncbi:hypothetical protein J7T55_011013 [Diaporthe amygdali]|uniref:uncharacterized protein n=1 Tax=Phomopsis amygdali TaxID=1214568 RepID=UPI0022FEF56B|nr:uncharacterized protein J7T55_011013 [Diaporthe amygdali]KAJ0100690.1 hypothetical protein J7T55_011013 [Diaporthe amygdali]
MLFSLTKIFLYLFIATVAQAGRNGYMSYPCAAFTLPTSNLPAPGVNLTVTYVSLGHGIQNYTCASENATATAIGALAVLYDITSLYPGVTSTSLSADDFDGLSANVLWNSEIPLNLIDAAAAAPGSSVPEPDYQADPVSPFPVSPSDLACDGISAKFLGLHYFDAESSPTFDLVGGTDPAGLFFSGAKTGDVKAPTDADQGVLATGAVNWLQLSDNGRGLTSKVAQVYRVVTAGGGAQACSASGANDSGQVLSVPYTAQYWFYST